MTVMRASRLLIRTTSAAFATLALLLLIVPATAGAVTTQSTPFIRANGALNHMRLDPKGRFIAFVNEDGLGLNVVDMKTRNIHEVTRAQVGASFFWSPDGFRLFYRELSLDKNKQTQSEIKAYDCALSRSVTLDRWTFPTGLLTFDPRDLRFHVMSPKGIRTKRIYFPDERLARWQVAQRTETGKWLVTQNGVLWVTQGGFAMRRLEDDGSGLHSFDISPDGNTIAWATRASKIYTSKKGGASRFLAYGLDPLWHPRKTQLLFAGARMVGNTPVSYDIRLSDGKVPGKFLTTTQASDERWPQWHPREDQIIYTVGRTTDIYLLEFKQ